MNDDATDRSEVSDGPDLEIPEYNPRAVRRASRRGVVRTALLVMVVLVVVLLVVQLITTSIAHAHRPYHHTVTAAESAPVATPGYLPYSWMDTNVQGDSLSRTGEYHATLTYVEPDANGDPRATSQLRLHQSLFGDFTVKSQLETTKVGRAVRDNRPTKNATRQMLNGLPESTATASVVEFTAPMSEAEVHRRFGPLEMPHSTDGTTMFFTPFHAPRTTNLTGPRGGVSQAYRNANGNQPILVGFASPDPATATTTGMFVDYANHLHKSDDGLLATLGLPGAATLQRIAKEGNVYGFVLYGASPAQVRRLLDQSVIRSIEVADVEFKTMASGA